MTNPRKRRRSRKNYHRKHRSRRNPFAFKKRYSRRHRRSNPFAGMSAEHLAKLGIGAAFGGFVTRALPQYLLGSSNSGPIGYLADLAAAIAAAWAAKKFGGSEFGDGAAAGGVAAVVLRVLNEQFGITAGMSGLGDAEFGAYVQSGFPLPTSSTSQGPFLVTPPGLPPAAISGAPTVGLATGRHAARG